MEEICIFKDLLYLLPMSLESLLFLSICYNRTLAFRLPEVYYLTCFLVFNTIYWTWIHLLYLFIK